MQVHRRVSSQKVYEAFTSDRKPFSIKNISFLNASALIICANIMEAKIQDEKQSY